jgi:hypothetical protein
VTPLQTDATTALLRALRLRFRLLGVNFVNFEQVLSRQWASVTFTGARHEMTLRLDGEDAEAAADRFTAGLDVAEFALRGHILADIVAVSRESAERGVRLRLEALTVEDG